MPGLSHRRAMALNLAGSSASNLLPFGGVVGAGLNAAMVRSWRLSVRNFVSSTAVLNLVNLVTKLLLPVIAGIALGSQRAADPWLVHTAYVSSAVAAVVVLALIAALISHAWAVRMDALVRAVGRRLGRRGTRLAKAPADGVGPVTAMQAQVRRTFRRRWVGLTTGHGRLRPAAVGPVRAVHARDGRRRQSGRGLCCIRGGTGVDLGRRHAGGYGHPPRPPPPACWSRSASTRPRARRVSSSTACCVPGRDPGGCGGRRGLGVTADGAIKSGCGGVCGVRPRRRRQVHGPGRVIEAVESGSGPGGPVSRQPDSGPAVTTSPTPSTINPPTASRR